MQRAKPFLQVAAVISAVFLVGALVAYRAGAFTPPTPAPPPELQPETQPVVGTPASDPQPAASLDHTIMYGYKSAPAIVPPPAPPTPNQPSSPAPVFMSGSKSKVILDPAALKKPEAPNAPAPPTPPKP